MEANTITCPNAECGSKLKKNPNPYVRCANCRISFFSFCHEFPDKTYEYVPCKRCTNELYYFFCVKCRDVLCFKNYRMGSISKCKCGFNGCYVVCNNCKNFQCYPPNKSYEGLPWCCTRCNQPFNFMTCGNCFHPIYRKQFSEQESVKCVNQGCASINKVKTCRDCQQKYLDTRDKILCTRCQKKGNSLDKLNILKQPVSLEKKQNPLTPPPPSSTNKPSFTPITPTTSHNLETAKVPEIYTPQPIRQNNLLTPPQSQTPRLQKSFGKQIEFLCKICLDKPNEYINKTCFHMSCCGSCVDSLKNICPICRAQGEFQKVFR